MNDIPSYFITWRTYGTWLPGDSRGWRKRRKGDRKPQPLLEDWCRERLSEQPVILAEPHRDRVEAVCQEHATLRGWELHTVSARSNHVHLVVSANEPPKKVRDQFKANATRVLRLPPDAIKNEKIWARGGDIELIDGDEALEPAVIYTSEAQDRMDRGK